MDKKALYKLSYGVFMLSTAAGGKTNGCITNTCIQVAGEPVRVALSVLNSNYTCDLLKESGVLSLSLLDRDCPFDTIKHFGFQSGRDVDKFADLDLPKDDKGLPYLKDCSTARISGTVVQSLDLGTHTLFIATVDDAEVLTGKAPLTYDDYQTRVKPKRQPKAEKKVVAWRCRICGYIYEGEKLPEDYACPLCGHGPDDFEPIYEEAPAKAPEKPIVGWKCKICGYIYEGEKLPEDFVCPLCGHDASDFEPVYADEKAPEKKSEEPAEKSGGKITGWKCKICGYVYEGEKLPEDFICPVCGRGAEDFEPVYA